MSSYTSLGSLQVDGEQLHMHLYNYSVHLLSQRYGSIDTRPVHCGDDPQDIANHWKKELTD